MEARYITKLKSPPKMSECDSKFLIVDRNLEKKVYIIPMRSICIGQDQRGGKELTHHYNIYIFSMCITSEAIKGVDLLTNMAAP